MVHLLQHRVSELIAQGHRGSLNACWEPLHRTAGFSTSASKFVSKQHVWADNFVPLMLCELCRGLCAATEAMEKVGIF